MYYGFTSKIVESFIKFYEFSCQVIYYILQAKLLNHL